MPRKGFLRSGSQILGDKGNLRSNYFSRVENNDLFFSVNSADSSR